MDTQTELLNTNTRELITQLVAQLPMRHATWIKSVPKISKIAMINLKLAIFNYGKFPTK